MKNKTFKALVLSAIGFAMCVVMLTGTTFAWFTSSSNSDNNIVRTATYNVSLQKSASYANGYGNITNALIDATLAPGNNTAPLYLKVTNSNTYAVNVAPGLSIAASTNTSDTTDTNGDLKLYYKVAEGTVTFNEDTATTDGWSVMDLKDAVSTTNLMGSGNLAQNESKVLAIVIGLPKTATTADVQVKFTIVASANQVV